MVTIILAIAALLFAGLWIRSIRKRLIMRHLFIHFTDWSATKIDEMIDGAVHQALRAEERLAAAEGRSPREDDALGSVYYSVSDAKKEWEQQIDETQRILRVNGMAPLNIDDKDLPLLTPWISGIRR